MTADESDALNDLPLGPVSAVLTASEAADMVRLTRRRAEVDTHQEQLGRILAEMSCEGCVLLVPAHVSWFCAGLNLRGLFSDSERPGIYTNGRQRWLLCSTTDTQRFFDEELDGLGFQVKEWQWASGRATLLAELIHGKKFTVDRPFPNLPMLNEKLRLDLRALSPYELEEYRKLGKVVAHAIEATARTMPEGLNEEEVAGHISHRLLHRGVECVSVSATADDRGIRYRRSGFTRETVGQICTLQATGSRHGLYATASRSVCFGTCPAELRAEFDAACKVSAVYRSYTIADQTIGAAGEAGWKLLTNTPWEYEGRLSQPGYGTGRWPAEELRRGGTEDPFAVGWPIVWQARVGRTAVVDTLVISEAVPDVITPPESWPFKRITVKGHTHDVPDLMIRS